jgi:SAM-dependent methyltransferase
MRGDPLIAALVDAASAPYRAASRFAWHFARGKLTSDPAFAAILARGLLSERARILDLGCGQGLLAAWLLAARAAYREGRWPGGWPPAAAPAQFTGVEINPREVARAHTALGDRARIVQGDIRHVDYGSVDAIVILDVLHFIDSSSQEAVLRRARAALAPQGILLLRVADAAGGLGFTLGKLVDRAVAFARRGRLVKLTCRTASEWRGQLVRLGFMVEALPMSQGTPFANVLFVGRLSG